MREIGIIVALAFGLVACSEAGSGAGGTGGTPDASVTGDGSGTTGDGAAGTGDGGPGGEGTTGGDATAGGGGGPSGSLVRFVTPAGGEQVTGSVRVDLAPVGVDELIVDRLEVRANGEPIFYDTKLPTGFVLDTREVADGSLQLSATAELGDLSGADSRTVKVANPQLRILEVTPVAREVANGRKLGVFVETTLPNATLTADLSAIDSGFDASQIEVVAITPERQLLSYTVTASNARADGHYPVSVSATVGGETVDHGLLELELVNAKTIPFAIRGGIYVPAQLPLPSPTWIAPAPAVSASSNFVITGGSVALNANFANLPDFDEVIGLVVGLEGHHGYWQLPLDSPDGLASAILLMRAFLPTETPPSLLPVRIALRDASGAVSPYSAQHLTVTQVGSGDIQVSISWDTETDVDLHVVEPSGCELYYGNDDCDSGGQLDLDSNPGCSMDYVNNENVFWPPGESPVGTYTVRVDFYEDCGSHGANYTVTLNYCGSTEIVQGHFDPNTDTGGGAGDGVTVATFSNASCQKAIRGNVAYQDKTFDEHGFGAFEMKPVRYAVVELKRLSDGEVLGTATTDRFGAYEIRYGNDGTREMAVEVLAMTDPEGGLRDIQVLNHPKFKTLYRATSDEILDQDGPASLRLDVDIVGEPDAGAFNIFDVVLDGHDQIRRRTGTDLGEVRAYWAIGADTTDTLFCSKYFYDNGVCSELGALSIQGKDTDRDEYDDMVVLKEFFKLALERYSRDDNPGGAYNGTRGDARRAWSEGVSAFFANDVLQTRHFVNSRPRGVYLVDDVEAMATPFAFGTTGATLDGELSELLVSAVLWDLSDGEATEVFDRLVSLRQGVYDVLFNYFTHAIVDRGPLGLDLTEFLDGWICRGWGHQTALADLLVVHRGFPYDFDGPSGCAGGTP